MKTKWMMMAVVIMMTATEGRACGQLGRPPVETSFNEASSVFVGKVIGERKLFTSGKSYELTDVVPVYHPGEVSDEIREYEIKISKVFKGTEKKALKIYTMVQSSCAENLDVGSIYLIYAHVNKSFQNRLFVSSGSPNRKLSLEEASTDQEIIALEKLEKNNDR